MRTHKLSLIITIKRKLIATIRLVASELRGSLSYFRRNRNYVEERWTGINDGKLDGKVCVFVHFDRKGEIHDYVLHYLRALRLAGFNILFISNAPTLKPAALSRVLSLSSVVLRRANAGYDFGAYKDGIANIPDLKSLELLLLANDSVYGPFTSLAAVIDRTRETRAQFWGLTDCWDVAYHLQSYFLLFGPEAINSVAFEKFGRTSDTPTPKPISSAATRWG